MSRSDRPTEYVELALTVKYESAHAVLVSDGGEPVWIPDSCIANRDVIKRYGETVTLEIAEWCAKDRGLI